MEGLRDFFREVWNELQLEPVRNRRHGRLQQPRDPFWTMRHGNVKYTAANRNLAIRHVREGVTYREIARRIGPNCSTSTIHKWVRTARRQGFLPTPQAGHRPRHGRAVVQA